MPSLFVSSSHVHFIYSLFSSVRSRQNVFLPKSKLHLSKASIFLYLASAIISVLTSLEKSVSTWWRSSHPSLRVTMKYNSTSTKLLLPDPLRVIPHSQNDESLKFQWLCISTRWRRGIWLRTWTRLCFCRLRVTRDLWLCFWRGEDSRSFGSAVRLEKETDLFACFLFSELLLLLVPFYVACFVLVLWESLKITEKISWD